MVGMYLYNIGAAADMALLIKTPVPCHYATSIFIYQR